MLSIDRNLAMFWTIERSNFVILTLRMIFKGIFSLLFLIYFALLEWTNFGRRNRSMVCRRLNRQKFILFRMCNEHASRFLFHLLLCIPWQAIKRKCTAAGKWLCQKPTVTRIARMIFDGDALHAVRRFIRDIYEKHIKRKRMERVRVGE